MSCARTAWMDNPAIGYVHLTAMDGLWIGSTGQDKSNQGNGTAKMAVFYSLSSSLIFYLELFTFCFLQIVCPSYPSNPCLLECVSCKVIWNWHADLTRRTALFIDTVVTEFFVETYLWKLCSRCVLTQITVEATTKYTSFYILK